MFLKPLGVIFVNKRIGQSKVEPAACIIASALPQHYGRSLGDELFDWLSPTGC